MSTSPASEHPLLYASLTSVNSHCDVPHMKLYKPKTKYSIGRNPQSDIVLDSELFGGPLLACNLALTDQSRKEWSFCELVWDGRDEIRIQDLHSVNGVWVRHFLIYCLHYLNSVTGQSP